MATSSTYPPEVCKKLDNIVEARDQEKAREQDLLRTRKSLKNDLLELGYGSTKQHLEVSREYVVTLFGIEASRARQRHLSDLTDSTIKGAHQAKLIDDDDHKIDGRELDERTIFETLRAAADHGDDHEDTDQANLPVGENGAALNGEARAVNDGYAGAPGDGLTAPEMTANVKDLDLDTKIADKLIKAGVTTIGALVKLDMDPQDGVQQVKGITGTQAAAIRKALRAWQKNQNAGELATAQA